MIISDSAEFEELMEWDRHYEIADNYLISVALIYLLRARYTFQQFTFFNLMVALYLAHEVEEEDWINRLMRPDLIRSAFGSRAISEESYRLFMKKKEKLWRSLAYDVIVKREESDAVMSRLMREDHVWGRMRSQAVSSPRPSYRSFCLLKQRCDTDLSASSASG